MEKCYRDNALAYCPIVKISAFKYFILQAYDVNITVLDKKTLAYCINAKITAVKCFIVPTSVIKNLKTF